jgi:hypothetical protein
MNHLRGLKFEALDSVRKISKRQLRQPVDERPSMVETILAGYIRGLVPIVDSTGSIKTQALLN